jgi:uncharacterized small protein (DUF1192 family)
VSFEDEFLPKPKAAKKLEDMGVEEINERISLLEAEIEACKAMLKRKGSDRAAADALFSKKG